MTEKFKSWLLDDVVFYALLLVSVAIVAFLLGRNSFNDTQPQAAGVQISQSQIPQSIENIATETVSVIASRSGAKYHLPDCPGAKQIKASNKISFSTIEQAKAAGYSAAANCPGLQ